MIRKKGQIGATLSWVAAFFIIFFIMFIFVGAAFLIAKNKEASVIGGGEDENVNLADTESILGFLSTPILIEGESKKVADLVLMVKKDSKYDEQLIGEMKDFINIFNSDCYIFRTDVIRFGNPVGIINLFGYGGRGNSRQIQDDFVSEKGTTISLYYVGQEIKLEFYAGKCEL